MHNIILTSTLFLTLGLNFLNDSTVNETSNNEEQVIVNKTIETSHDDVNRITELHANLESEEQARIDEERRVEEERRLEEEKREAEKKKAEEEKKLAEEKKANEIKKAKLAEEARKQEEARKAEALRLAAEEEEKKIAEEEVASNEDIDRGMNGIPTGQTMIMESTAYSSDPADSLGGGHITATGQNLLENPMAVAVDPNFIPLGTKLYVEGYGTAYAVDTGGAIKGGNIIDVHFPTYEECIQWGRRQVKVTILE